MMKYLMTLMLTLILTGCGQTGLGDMVRGKVADRGAEAMDEGVNNSMWWLCNAASVGSIKREFGVSSDRAEAYRRLCDGDSEARVIEPEE